MSLPRLDVHASGRYLVTEDGRGFFWLADTAWELFHRLSREEADVYLRDRAAKHFTVIQAVVLAELDGVKTPNAAGHYPLLHEAPTCPNEAYFEDVDWVVRRYGYWALFSGACGHTYGCNDIWQMWRPGLAPMVGANTPWYDALKLPGSGQMQHARALIEGGPYFERLPDPSLIEPPNCSGPDYVAACRGPRGEFALVYFPSGKPATVRTYLLQEPCMQAAWYDPRTGARHPAGEINIAPWKSTPFMPPSADDWVLIVSGR